MRPNDRGRPVLAVTVALAALTVGAGAVWYAVWPPRSAPSYREHATSTVQAWRSQIETARLWVDAHRRERVTDTAVLVAFKEAEFDTADTLERFRSLDPPAPLAVISPMRQRVLDSGNRSVSLLGELRINAQAGRWDDVAASDPALERMSAALKGLQETFSL